jgi:phosphatidylserine/phosphatidylglycerophosphate/cardiolipin synthase-like enzyme
MDGISLLNASELRENIKNMFKEEKKRLIIVSPFNNKDKNLELIQLLSASNAYIHLFFKSPIQKRDKDIIENFKSELKNINYFEIKNLHAKAYISNKESIVSSLNLNANDNNFELGLKFDNNIFSKLYEKMINELKELLRINEYDMNSIENNEIYLDYDEYNKTRQNNPILNMKYLYRAIMKKYDKDWVKEDENDNIYRNICSQMIQKYKFTENNYYRDKTALNRQTELNEEQYKYGINNFIIDV